MISNIAISNFRCFPSVSAELRPLTVLIGPNDSGKSAFLEALRRVVNGVEHFNPVDCWGMQPRNNPQINVHTTGGNHATIEAGVRLKRDAQQEWEQYKGTSILRPPASGLVFRGPSLSDAAGPPDLDPEGKNFPALLDYVLRRDRRRHDLFAEAARRRIPGLEDIQVSLPSGNERSIDVVLAGGLLIPYENISVGVRMMIYFLALAYHPRPPGLVLLEEPEIGIHPARLKEVVELLRGMTQGEHCGRQVQVIFTTHSPYVLDHIHLDTDQVLVFQRQADGVRTVQAADPGRLRTFLDEFLLGEVWFNQQEEGLVAKPR